MSGGVSIKKGAKTLEQTTNNKAGIKDALPKILNLLMILLKMRACIKTTIAAKVVLNNGVMSLSKSIKISNIEKKEANPELITSGKLK